MANEEFWSSVGYWIVVAGLVGDIIVLVVPKHRERLEKVLAAFFTIVIIVGVAIEHRADAAISLRVSQEQQATGLQIAQLDKEAGEARKTAGEQTRQAEIFKQQNLLLQNEVLKLREKMADRHLTAEQQENIAAKLRPFAGQRISVLVYSGQGEVVGIANEVIAALGHNGAGWRVSVSSGQEPARSVVGILVETRSNATKQDRLAAATLASLLRAANLTVDGPVQSDIDPGGLFTGESDPNALIKITIGTKSLANRLL